MNPKKNRYLTTSRSGGLGLKVDFCRGRKTLRNFAQFSPDSGAKNMVLVDDGEEQELNGVPRSRNTSEPITENAGDKREGGALTLRTTTSADKCASMTAAKSALEMSELPKTGGKSEGDALTLRKGV